MAEQPRYPDRFNPDLLDRMPLTARVVVDVGCHTGALGAAYLRRNPNARVLGIDADADAVATAASRLHEVAHADVEAAPFPFDLPDGADCLVYGDVLEHLRDPWAVLRRHLEHLRPDGTILVCVPNIEHWSFAQRLLRGGWDYEQAGLLDRSHMRWFSQESMRAGLSELGLNVWDVTPRVFDSDAAIPFLRAMDAGLRALGIDPAEYASRALPLQYIWRARRTPPPLLRIAATALAPVGGVTDLRVTYPLRAMATEPGVITRLTHMGDFPPPPDKAPAIAVLHRPALRGPDGLAHLRRLHQAGWLTVTEFDDHPDHFPIMRGDEQYSFAGVHAVQTTTKPLADILRPRNPEVAIFPNAIRELPEPRNFASPDTLTLFFGALNREADWRDLLGVLNDVAARAGDRLRFQVVHDQAFHAGLGSAHKHFTPTCDHATYLSILGGCELSFMPLADTAFNRAKSDLKFIEAAACRAVPVASPVVYADSIADGRTGVIFRDAAELHARLLQLIAYPQMAREIAEAARAEIIRTRMLADQVAARLAWYRDLWARRQDLSAALVARVPELAG